MHSGSFRLLQGMNEGKKVNVRSGSFRLLQGMNERRLTCVVGLFVYCRE